MSRITIIRPPTIVAKWAHTSPTCPPVGMAYIAASLKEAGHTVQAIDATGEAIRQMLPAAKGADVLLAHGLTNAQIVERIDKDADFIGVSCMFSHEWPQTKDLIEGIRERFPKIPIIAGGEHVTAEPVYSMEQCPALDYCVMGEGEEVMNNLVATLSKDGDLSAVGGLVWRSSNGIVKNAPQARIRDIDSIPEPDWAIFPLEQYLDNGFGFGVARGRNMPIIATRGCPYQCTFCSNPTMWTTRWIARNPDAVLEEMKFYKKRYNATNFDFYDLTAVVKRDWIIEFANKLIKENMDVTWQLPSGTRSEAIDAEVADLLYRSGCRNLSYAPESGSPAVLERIKKKVQLSRMIKSMRQSVGAGLNIKANIIMGFPDETHFEMWETLLFVMRLAVAGVHDVYISPFSPYPGSELFAGMRKSGQIEGFSDQYFIDLTAYTDITTAVSYSKYVHPRWLMVYRIFGVGAFYLLSYLVRPWRIISLIYHLAIHKHESRLEMSLHDLLVRLTNKFRTKTA